MKDHKEMSYYQNLNLIASFIMAFVMASTSPFVHVYMIQHISVDFYKIVNFLNEISIMAILFWLDRKDENNNPKIIRKLRFYFIPIVIGGCILYITANISGLIDVRIRFIILSTLDGIFGYLWKICMEDLWNNLIHNTDLTAWANKISKWDRIGAAIGATIVLFANIGIEIALTIQCLAYCYLGYTDYISYKNLKNQAYSEFKEKNETI